jgi:hypothetical protein
LQPGSHFPLHWKHQFCHRIISSCYLITIHIALSRRNKSELVSWSPRSVLLCECFPWPALGWAVAKVLPALFIWNEDFHPSPFCSPVLHQLLLDWFTEEGVFVAFPMGLSMITISDYRMTSQHCICLTFFMLRPSALQYPHHSQWTFWFSMQFIRSTRVSFLYCNLNQI